MNLEHFIQNLLYHFDCVIIPNFGGMVAQPLSASINASQHIFYAPKKQLAFNKNLDMSDGLLVNHVALNMNISYAESCIWVEKQVQKWKQQLQDSGKLIIAEVGQFKLDKEQNILFEPASFVNYQIESFGFSSFHASPVAAIKPEPVKKEKAKPAFVKAKTEKKRETQPFNFKKLIPYAIALPLVAAMVYIPTQTTLLKNTKVYYSNLLPIGETYQAVYSERIAVALPSVQMPVVSEEVAASESANETPVTAAANAASEAAVPAVSKPVEVASSKKGAHLIVGAFSTEEIAKSYISELSSKGYQAYIQGKSASGLFRVSCKHFSSKVEASSAKAELPADINGWVLSE